jgi:hypothetical protein
MKSLIKIYEQVTQQITGIELFKKYWHTIKDMLYIYYFQTSEEKERERTELKNFEGFQGPDATILSPLCKQLINTGWLSPQQIEIIPNKMKKYQKQLDKIESRGLLDNDSEFKNLVRDVIDKWKKVAKHNFNKWFGIMWYGAVSDFTPKMMQKIKDKSREYGLYIFKMAKFYTIFIGDYNNLIKLMKDEEFKGYKMSIHPATDYQDFIGISTKGLITNKFGFYVNNDKNWIVRQFRKPENLIESRLLLLKEWGEASEKQLKYLSFLTKHDWTKLYVPFGLASKLITLAKDQNKSYEELMDLYNANEDVKRQLERDKERLERDKERKEAEEFKKKLEITIIQAKKYLMNNENKLVSFMNDILKKSINNKTQPYSLSSKLKAKILDKKNDNIADLKKYVDIDKLSEYIKNKYFNNRIGKYFDTIGWPIELMITHNKKVFGFVAKIIEDYLKQKLGYDNIKIEIE